MCRPGRAQWICSPIPAEPIGRITAPAGGISTPWCRAPPTPATPPHNSPTWPTNGSGIITSLQAEYPIPLPLGSYFILEPEGQILWQHTSFSQANDGLGPVALGTTSGTTVRLGIRGQCSIDTESGQVWQPYAAANLWQNRGGESTTSLGVDQVLLLQEATQLEFDAAATAKLNARLSLYAQAGYEFAVGDTDGDKRQSVCGTLGPRYAW